MDIIINFANETAGTSSGSPFEALGVSPGTFIIQLATFIMVFLLLKKFAFKPIQNMLEERRITIEKGVKMGQELQKERQKFEKQLADITKEARHEADKIIHNAHKEARDIIHQAETTAARKTDTMLSDAEAQIHEEALKAKHKLERQIVGLIAEATEAVVGQKVDATKDSALIDKIMKDLTKS